jgi:glycosidase
MEHFNPLDKFYKSQTGAVREDQEITFRVKGNFNSVVFVLNKDGESEYEYYNLTKKEDYFECSIKFSRGLYFYCFQVDSSNKYIGLSNKYKGQILDKICPFQLTVYDKEYKIPKWVNGGVIYQIFPDRYAIGKQNKQIEKGKILHDNLLDTPIFEPNSQGEVLNNDFFGGDLQGIIDKLDYLKELGVSIIYLNPIFKAYSNHRYDTGDYMQIDPLLGDINDFKELINKAKSKGIKIVLDGVFNHTGADSLYFNKYGNYEGLGAYQSKKSKYYSWYNFSNFPDKYESWWGIKTLPAVNEKDFGFIDFITGENGVLDYYTKLGIGGWRLDVVDELPGFFVKKIRDAVKRVNKDAIIIGEVWEDASNKIAYDKRREYFQGFELDSVMNYPLKNAIIDFVKSKKVDSLSYVVSELIDHYPKEVLDALMNILATHDTYRLLSAVGGPNVQGLSKQQMAKVKIADSDYSNAIFNLKVATLLQYTMPGVPTIYYGDEIGMEGYSDPLNRKFFDWQNKNDEILDWYKFLGELRKKYNVLSDGDFYQIYSKNGTFIYKRTNKECELLIAVNVGDRECTLDFEGELFDLISKNVYRNQFLLKANSYAVLVSKTN